VLATQGRLDEALDCHPRALALEEGFGATALAARTALRPPRSSTSPWVTVTRSRA
jgi:hypothetical protein